MKMTVCKRCGKCCWYVIPNKEGKLILKKCKHLVRNFHTKKTVCRSYNKRKQLRYKNGICIDTYYDKEGIKRKVFCTWRNDSKFNYKGCPFNIKGNKQFEKYCIENKVIGNDW